nr:MAG TPA: NinB protein [Caudoviricetes sp.]
MTSLQFDRAKWSQDSEGIWLSLRVKFPALAKKFMESIKDGLYVAEIKEYRKKRSLDANAYFWLLAGKFAAKVRIPVDTIYRQYIRDIGDNFEIVPVRTDAKDRWVKNWESRGLGWLCNDLETSKLDGYTNIVCYYGSSTYDTAQMSRLIDLVVQDCKDQDIETATPEQLALIKDGWGK